MTESPLTLKYAKVDWMGQDVFNIIVLENSEDWEKYAKWSQMEFDDQIVKAFRSESSPNQWRGLANGTGAGAVWSTTIHMQQMFEGRENFWVELSKAANSRLMMMHKQIMKGNTVLVKPNGSYCTEGNDIKIVKMREIPTYQPANVHIEDWGNVLCLEEDHYVKEEMKELLGDDYSYATNLHSFNIKELQDILNEFTLVAEGDTVVIQTSGVDTSTMKKVFNAIVEAGIPNVHIYLEEKVDSFLKLIQTALIDKDINVHILNSNQSH